MKTRHTLLILLLIVFLPSCQKNKTQGPAQLPSEVSKDQFALEIAALLNDLEISSYNWVLHSNTEILAQKEEGVAADQTFVSWLKKRSSRDRNEAQKIATSHTCVALYSTLTPS